MSIPSTTTLQLDCNSGCIAAFSQLLQQGVMVSCRVGCSLGEMLDQQWGISPEYVAQRVTTVFLNSRAIDNVNSAMVNAGATIALSGAMPGLVGATMRRGGYYAAMRGAMTHKESAEEIIQEEATVRVKLFNLVLGELGPGFLKRGIIISGVELLAILREHGSELMCGCLSAKVDGSGVDPASILDGPGLAGIESIRLTVLCRDKI